jgi:hypothetical protein
MFNFKSLLFSLYLTLFFVQFSCFSQAKIEFISKEIFVDTLYEGELKPVQFIFKNVGDSDLVISAVKSSCGCTVPKYSIKSVAPNTYDTIIATYNTVGHLGEIDKLVRVESNASNGGQDLYIKGYALPYAANLRIYYSSSVPDVQYHLDRNKNITYTIHKPTNNRQQDISLVVYQNDNNKSTFAISKEELAQKGIGMRIMKQSNKSVSIEYIDPATLILSKEYTYILQFTLADRMNKFITVNLNGKKFKISFDFVD